MCHSFDFLLILIISNVRILLVFYFNVLQYNSIFENIELT